MINFELFVHALQDIETDNVSKDICNAIDASETASQPIIVFMIKYKFKYKFWFK